MALLKIGVRTREMRPVLQAKLAHEPPLWVFDLLFEAQMVDTPLLYSLKSHIPVADLFADLNQGKSLEVLLKKGVVLDAELLKHFRLAPRKAELPPVKSYSLLLSEYECVGPDVALDFYRQVKKEFWAQDGFPRALFSTATRKHLAKICRTPRLLLDAVVLLLSMGEGELLSELMPALRPLCEELGHGFFLIDRPEALFRQQVFIFVQLFDAINAMDGPLLETKAIKSFVRTCCELFEAFLTRTLFTEDVHASLAAANESDKHAPKSEAPMQVGDFDIVADDVDVLFRFFGVCADKNIGTASLVLKLCSLFAKSSALIVERHLPSLVYRLAQVNIPHAELDGLLISHLQGCAFDAKLGLPAAFYLALRDQKIGVAGLRNLPALSEAMRSEDRVAAFLVREIAKAHQGVAETEAVEAFADLFPVSDFSTEIAFFVSHLHLQDLERQPVRPPLTAHFGQKGKLLVCLDYDMCSLDSENPRGIAALALRFLCTRCDSVSVVLKTSFDRFDSRNRRMHHLLQQLRGWKIDYAARERQMNRAYDALETHDAR